jgi:Protein of unknown function (DUF2855)
MAEFQVQRNGFAQHRLVDTAPPALADGEALLKIDRFAFTANNITYAALGDKMAYWQFFPAAGEDAATWGLIPVWGFADVVASKAEGVPVGDRLFGYFPPASHLKMSPVRVSATRLFDGAAHRTQLPAGYNSYSRVLAEAGYNRQWDDARALLSPLHLTSFCLWDMLQAKQWFGAKQVVILSASSKTSMGLAGALQADTTAPPVIGLTSDRNLAYVRQHGLYTQALSYDELTQVDATVPTVVVDMSGSSELQGRLHNHLGDNMQRCINVGLTHWGETKPHPGVNTARSELFFAPGHIQQRMKDWGPEGFSAKSSAFLKDAAVKSRALLQFTHLSGLTGLAAVYDDVREGRASPDQGLIVKM